MDLSKLRSRRNILALALAGVAARVAPVKAAQSTAGCDIGFTNGLLTIGGDDCQLLSPPGMNGAEIGLPPQMVDGRSTSGATSSSNSSSMSSQGTSSTGTSTTSTPSSSTTSPQAERQARLQDRRDKKRRKRGRKTNQKQTQKGRRHTRRQERIDALITCDDFSTQKAAIEWMNQYEEDRTTLDPDDDGIACEELTKVSCSQFTDGKDAKAWLKLHGFFDSTIEPDGGEPFGLYDDEKDEFCPANG